MITKIFYSLVLFPKVQFNESILGYKLLSIIENDFGVIELIFSDNQRVLFKHISILNSKSTVSIKNRKILSQNKELCEELIKRLYDEDLKKDFNFFDNKELNRKRPFGVVLTITSKCNIFCYYCFNDIDYDLKYRNLRKNHGLEYWKNIIDSLYLSGTRVVILTGGEPMVAPFFRELLDYLKYKNIFIHINTNGTVLQDKVLERLNENYSVNLMVSMHEFNNTDYYEVNKKGLKMTFEKDKVPKVFYELFTKKVDQLRKVNKLPNISLEFLTILNWKNILNLRKIYEFGENSGINIHNWQFFRLYGTKNNEGASKTMMEIAIRYIYNLNKKFNKNYKIVDPVPFCVTKEVEKASEVIDGVLSDTHDVKTIITTEGYVQLMSAYDNNFWNISDTNITEIFNSEFVYKQLNNGFLPKQCLDCKFKKECRGGSRMDANLVYGDYGLQDPIADFSNKVKI